MHMANTPETKPTDLGKNRTGLQMAPLQAKKMLENTAAVASATFDPLILATPRAEIARMAPPVGTMPPPATLKGMAKSALKALTGEKATVFLDKLGQRLAFERTGVRLYEAVLAKIPAASNDDGTLTAAAVRRIHDDELSHFLLVKEAIEQMGGDPTAQTPCADLVGVQGMGLVQSVTDPRTTLTQCLDTLLAAELIDNDSWAVLIGMAEAMGQTDLAKKFVEALTAESQHLELVRGWITERLSAQLGERISPERLGAGPAHGLTAP
jgi:hypothetical protein